jgi:integrase
MPPEVAAHLAWLAQRGRAWTTIYDRGRLLIRLAAFLPVPLLDATPAMLAGWRASMNHAPGVVCGYVSHASQFYRWAVAEGLAASNPAVLLPVPRRPRRLPRPIPTPDLMDALECAPGRIRLWLVLAAWCGLRCKEIALLRAECVILSASPVILVAADATKGITERTVPLCEFVVTEFRAAGRPVRGWMFLRADGGGGPNSPHTVSRLVNDHLRACGSPATCHQLRHWFGTEAYRACRDLRAVQEMMGHADPATTAGYAAYDNPSAAAAVAALPAPRRLRAVSE